MSGPLDGIRVFDWTLYGVGPFAGMLFGALGAEVIKVEGPNGDPQFSIPPTIGGAAALYISFNLNKRCVTIDLKSEQGRREAIELLRTADVFVNNMRRGTPEKYGLGWEDLRQYNPRLVYCACTGYGNTGPMADVGGGDPMVQAFCGWTSTSGTPGGRGELLRQQQQIDMNASAYLVAAVLEALYARERSGMGQAIDLSMLSASINKQRTRILEFLVEDRQPDLLGSAASSSAPHQAFQCQDREWLAVGVETEPQWAALCTALDSPSLASDSRFSTNLLRVTHRKELEDVLSKIFAAFPLAWWKLQLARNAVPCARLHDFERLRHHPQVKRNQFLPEMDTPWGKVSVGGIPWKFMKTPASLRASNLPGADTQSVFSEAESRNSKAPEQVSPKADLLTEGALSGVRVVELSQGIGGPYCGELLADAGADVVKVEPIEGDWLRSWAPRVDEDRSAAFLSVNRNKRSVVLSGREGRETFSKLLESADVVIADFCDATGRLNRPTYATLKKSNPNVIFCSLSAHGEQGPMARIPGTELTVQFMAGIPAGLGQIGEPPVRLGTDACFLYAGIYAYQGVMAALLHRKRTGEGQKVAVSALGATLNLKSPLWTCQSDPEQWGPPHMGAWTDPPQHGFSTLDLPVMIGFPRYSHEDLKRIFSELDADPSDADIIWEARGDFAKTRTPEVISAWERTFANHTARKIEEVFARHNGEILIYNDYPSLREHPQVREIGSMTEVPNSDGNADPTLAPAWRLLGTPGQPLRSAAPTLGQHTAEILNEYS
ncbi:CoA transferase [Myxococcota bacterium]|nr:CoA transferase [Myxococcota bacterium]